MVKPNRTASRRVKQPSHHGAFSAAKRAGNKNRRKECEGRIKRIGFVIFVIVVMQGYYPD